MYRNLSIIELLLCHGDDYTKLCKDMYLLLCNSTLAYKWQFSMLMYCLQEVSIDLDPVSVEMLYDRIFADVESLMINN